MLNVGIREESQWTYDTSASAGGGAGFVAGQAGNIYLKSPAGQRFKYHYGAGGGGVSEGVKLPGVGPLSVKGKGFSASGASTDAYSRGIVYILNSFKGKDLSPRDFLGACIMGEVAGGLYLGGSHIALVTGISPRDAQSGILEVPLVAATKIILGEGVANYAERLGLFDSMGPTGATALILAQGLNKGPQAGAGANLYIGMLTMGAPDDEDMVPIDMPPPGPHRFEIKYTNKEYNLSMPGDVLFDFDKSNLKLEAETTLLQAFSYLVSKQREGYRIASIEGHTDSIGGNHYNLQLSKQRAETVKQWFLRFGLKVANVPATGFGETRLLVTETKNGRDDPAARAKNRRVEIKLTRS